MLPSKEDLSGSGAAYHCRASEQSQRQMLRTYRCWASRTETAINFSARGRTLHRSCAMHPCPCTPKLRIRRTCTEAHLMRSSKCMLPWELPPAAAAAMRGGRSSGGPTTCFMQPLGVAVLLSSCILRCLLGAHCNGADCAFTKLPRAQ